MRFWRFTNLIEENNLATKGVVRVPVTVPVGEETKEVIFYVTHLQAKQKAAEVRREQLAATLGLIQNDQRQHPQTPIFLGGDLNVTNIEDDGSKTFERNSLQTTFFSNFVDFFALDHDTFGQRTEGSCTLLYQDFMDTDREDKTGSLPEPLGSFYDPSTWTPIPGCLYDYWLLHSRDPNEFRGSFAEIRRIFDAKTSSQAPLSDHLPLTVSIHLAELFSPVRIVDANDGI